MSATHRLLRFGVFELNLDTEELRKEGIPIKLGPQPFKVLAILTSRSGQIVARDEIREKIWGEETYVDFEHGLNQCIKQIRTALNDNTGRPLYIETFPRKGYRFLAPVTSKTIEVTPKVTPSTSGIQPKMQLPAEHGAFLAVLPAETSAEGAAAARQPAPGHTSENQVASEAIAAETAVTHESRPRPWWGILRWVAPVIFLGIAVAYYWHSESASALTAKDTIVIADFVNKTGDPVFDDTLRTAVTLALHQSPFLNVIPENKLRETLELMRRPADSGLSPEVAREVCQRADSKAYVSGSIASLGNQYVLELKVVNCRTDDVLVQQQVTARGKERVLNAVGEAAAKLRRDLGESLATVQKFDVPLEQATTSSLKALHAYSLGSKARREKGAQASLPYYELAIQLDPGFAMAYDAIGGDYEDLGEPARASEYITKAFELRDHASEWEKLVISASYYQLVSGQLDKAAQNFEEMIASYPRNAFGYLKLSLVYGHLGQYEKAVGLAYRAQSLAPDRVGAYEQLANALLASQHLEETRQTVQQAQARKLDGHVLHAALYALGFMGSDATSMAEQQQWFAASAALENFGLSLAADTEAYSGHMAKARETSQRSVDAAIRADNKEEGAIWWENAALREAAFGNPLAGRHAAANGLKLDASSLGVQVEAALALAMSGESAQAGLMAENLNERYALDTQVQALWLPAIRAQLALNRGDSAEAVSQLQRSLPTLEFGQISFIGNISCLYGTYVRGNAYLAAGQGTAAAVEFQKILDHSGIVWNCWTGALAKLGVARAYALTAGSDADSREKARAAYSGFLTLWQNADAQIPILQQAKAEYARLQ